MPELDVGWAPTARRPPADFQPTNRNAQPSRNLRSCQEIVFGLVGRAGTGGQRAGAAVEMMPRGAISFFFLSFGHSIRSPFRARRRKRKKARRSRTDCATSAGTIALPYM